MRTGLSAFVMLLLVIPTAASADRVNWSADVEGSLRSANESGRLVLMKFTADWCTYCKKMERETFTRPAVVQAVNQNFVPVLVDADKHKSLVSHLKIKGLPAILIVSPEMVILERISGYQTEEKLLPVLSAVSAKHRQTAAPEAGIAASPGYAPAATRPVSTPSTASPSFAAATMVAPAAEAPAVFEAPSFDGLCLPGVSQTRSLVRGLPQFALRYKGKTIYFSSEERMAEFQSHPEKYWPAESGICPVTLVESGRRVEGKLQYAAMFRNQLWLTSSAEQMQKFVAAPAKYADAVHTAAVSQ
ncbi:MAG: thioredoxin family protein [Planctomycetaceae bacterium]